MHRWSELIAALAHLVVLGDGGDGDGDPAVRRLVVDPKPHEVEPGDVVLAVGRESTTSFRALAASLPAGVAAGVVVRGRAPAPERFVEAVRSTGSAVAVLVPEANWIEVIERVRRLLGTEDREEQTWDLFEIAETAAEIADGPVTIEDLRGRVLAYAGDHSRADAAQVATILQRRVPTDVAQRMEAAGVPRLVARSGGAVVLPDIEGLAPRLAAPVRSGGEHLGTAWAIFGRAPDEASLRAFARCTQLSAVHLVRASRTPPAGLTVENEMLAALVYGGAGAAEAVRALGLDGHDVVVAVLSVHGGEIAEATQVRTRLRARLLALAERDARGLRVGDLNGTLYALMPARARTGAPHLQTWLEDQVLSGAVGAVHPPPAPAVVAGIGRPAEARSLPRSRMEAEAALALARAGLAGRRVCSYEDVWPLSFLHRLSGQPLAADLAAAGPVAVLAENDRLHATAYVDTLEAHLLTGGDARRAAERLHVHPNTFRYRMRRIEELVDLRLDQLETHAAVAVQVALRRLATRIG